MRDDDSGVAGMTMREMYAAHAAHGLLAGRQFVLSPTTRLSRPDSSLSPRVEEFAKQAFAIADAMLVEARRPGSDKVEDDPDSIARRCEHCGHRGEDVFSCSDGQVDLCKRCIEELKKADA